MPRGGVSPQVASTAVAVPNLSEALAAAVSAVGGAERAGQTRMVEAVAAAITDGRHLLVQAGTGTGKSLAYLVPALLHDDRVVVATATIALQSQIVDRDLPRLVDAVAPVLGRRPTYALLKGRRNYVCKNKLYGGLPADDGEALFDPSPTTRLGREVVRLRTWAETTESGDRDDLRPGVGERAWGQVSVSARECVGATACPYGAECFAERARALAAESDVVVTNHALLAIDALESGNVLPEHEVVVVDEAHEVVDRVTGVATQELTVAAVARAVSRCRRLLEDEPVELEAAGDALEAALAAAPVGRLPGLTDDVVEALVRVRDAAKAADDALARRKGGDEGAERTLARAAVGAVHVVAARVAGFSAYDVVWLSEDVRRGRVLHVAPLSIGGLLRAALFDRRTVIATSATLELGGSFDVVARSLGLNADGSGWTGLDVGSPFDYGRQGILYVARHLAPPGRDSMSEAVLDELAALVDAAGGRTLGLFSSMRAAETAAAALRDRLDVPVLCQGEDRTAELVRRFAADARTSLFGTMSLWQGVDVPGSALQLVVVDRIPFPRPDDPLMSARSEAAGPAGFMTVSAAHAALRLAQGAGRLIRSATDRGVVAVLDSRLATARYAAFLRGSLPPFWFTTDRAAVLAALARIDASAPPAHPVDEPSPASAVPAPRAERVAVVLGKSWTQHEDAALRDGIAAGVSLDDLMRQHGCTADQLAARVDALGLRTTVQGTLDTD
ncbi:MAG: ATP-dependent DNA helicase [Actinomycetota bacterium]|nr:ATP-dependent DNA helicase [Actinomycetota bacterium]